MAMDQDLANGFRVEEIIRNKGVEFYPVIAEAFINEQRYLREAATAFAKGERPASLA